MGASDAPHPEPQQCRISVLVPVMDHGEIVPCLKALAMQKGLSLDAFEVWAADAIPLRPWQRHAEKSIRRCGRGLRWQFIDAKPRGRAAALNAMLRQVRGDILLFLADDFIPDSKLVARHLHFHDRHPEPHRAAVGPGVFPQRLRKHPFARWLEDSGTLFGVPFTDPQLILPQTYFYAGNTSVKRALLDRAGTFEERFPYDAWDDYEMGLRLVHCGYEATYLPKAVCSHEHRVTLSARVAQVSRGGRSAAIYDVIHGTDQPWHEMVRLAGKVSRLEKWRGLASAWLHCKLNPDDAPSRISYYKLRLDHAFVDGYQRETQERPSSLQHG